VSAIQVVGAHAYLAGLNVAHESNECLTHLAQVHHPTHGARDFFVKYYFEDRAPKGLINEVCGYVLAESAGLSVPENPLLITLPMDRLVEIHGSRARRLSVGPEVAVWATQRVPGLQLPPGMEQAADVLRPWKSLPELIAFDTWVQNADRNEGNLIRRGRNDIVLIDHGHLAGSVAWTADLLQEDTDQRHPFFSLWGDRIPNPINQSIMRAAEGHAACFLRAETEMRSWTGTLIDASGDRIALLDFLRKRAAESPDRMRRVLNLLL
jgi:hypothetical protein